MLRIRLILHCIIHILYLLVHDHIRWSFNINFMHKLTYVVDRINKFYKRLNYEVFSFNWTWLQTGDILNKQYRNNNSMNFITLFISEFSYCHEIKEWVIESIHNYYSYICLYPYLIQYFIFMFNDTVHSHWASWLSISSIYSIEILAKVSKSWIKRLVWNCITIISVDSSRWWSSNVSDYVLPYKAGLKKT